MTKQISVARALSELKLTTSKINDKTNSLLVAQGVVTSRTSDEQRKTFKEKFKSDYQQIQDLISYRDKVKAAIVASNSSTDVVVAGKTMKVAEAIERKVSIELKKNLNRKLRTVYYAVVSQVEQNNNAVSTKADQQANAALSTASEADKGVQYKAITDAYKFANNTEVLSHDTIVDIIEKEDSEVVEFEAEVDFALSESNIKTMIEI